MFWNRRLAGSPRPVQYSLNQSAFRPGQSCMQAHSFGFRVVQAFLVSARFPRYNVE